MDTLKSVVLVMACMERFLPVEKAVLLARLEEEFQVHIVNLQFRSSSNVFF